MLVYRHTRAHTVQLHKSTKSDWSTEQKHRAETRVAIRMPLINHVCGPPPTQPPRYRLLAAQALNFQVIFLRFTFTCDQMSENKEKEAPESNGKKGENDERGHEKRH